MLRVITSHVVHFIQTVEATASIHRVKKVYVVYIFIRMMCCESSFLMAAGSDSVFEANSDKE